MNHDHDITSRRTLGDDQIRAVVERARSMRSAALRDLLISAGRALRRAFGAATPVRLPRRASPWHTTGTNGGSAAVTGSVS